jgi:hypothetical protein
MTDGQTKSPLLECSPARTLALAGLAHRIVPCLRDESSVAAELFAVDGELHRCTNGFMLLQATFATTDPATLQADDARTYRRELNRRKKHLAELDRRRDALLEPYARELLASGAIHPALQDLARRSVAN